MRGANGNVPSGARRITQSSNHQNCENRIKVIKTIQNSYRLHLGIITVITILH